MGLQLYDLAGAETERRFSPYCWRTKLALMHKGLPFDTIPWRFSEKNVIAFSGQGRVPVLLDGDQVVSDSWTIATYLEDAYADRPSLFRGDGGRAVTRFVNAWADGVLVGGILRLGYHRHFRASRREGPRLLPPDARTALRRGAGDDQRRSRDECARVPQDLGAHSHRARSAALLGWRVPAYADYIVFGCFQWARCISSFPLLLKDDAVWAWRDRLLSAFDGFARKALGYPV